ncbi:citrate synthase [Balneicella halophila]|uniref:citrate synthase (unknown stereospecificity) n=2 Tax=Balneicella halophila TaxID=1537566 RepID=A0A7L4UTA2_BALHA|nr:citrate synthase [Balneicella halophila]
MNSTLKQTLAQEIEAWRPRTKKLVKEYGDVVVDEVTISKVIGGMRGLKSLVSDISNLDPNEGIRYRGYSLQEVVDGLPKAPNSTMPYVEGLFYLLLTGKFPTKAEVENVVDEFAKRRVLPRYVCEILDAFPDYTHPMVMFSSAILSMSKESEFNRKYFKGNLHKNDFWDPTYEDALSLLAKLPNIASYIYNKLYLKGKPRFSDPNLDMGGNFAFLMHKQKPYDDVARMHFIVHSDHESGNVSAHTGHLVASSLSDVYMSTSAMLNGLAGPLHGLASQEVMKWLLDGIDIIGNDEPSEDEWRKFVWDKLNTGQVIPGYGHAVLRKTDPRYTLQRNFSKEFMSDDSIWKSVDKLYRIVPEVLKEHGKAKNPWPNVDAQSGVIQWHYGVREFEFYTVLFGISRAIGICANIIWDRALGYPLERPKSVTTEMLEKIAGIK